MENQTQNNQTKIKGKNDKIMAILAYIIFFLPWILVKDRSAFLNFHINQGFILFIISLIGSIVLRAVPFLFIVYPLWNLAMLLLVIIGILNVVHNRTKPLPLIGHFFDLVK
jgi:uncharacterized membrane protein